MLRNTDAKPFATLFQHVAETHALPANVSLTIMAMSLVETYQKPRFSITLLVPIRSVLLRERLFRGSGAKPRPNAPVGFLL